MNLTFKIGDATSADILSHLRDCDSSFDPLLSARVDLVAYSDKLSQKAITFEAWQGGHLVGLIAVYFTNLESRDGYISTVSIHPDLRGRGSANTLLEMVLRYAVEHGFSTLSLEVGENNLQAQSLYRKWEFENTGMSDGMVQMTCRTLENQS